MFVCCFVDDFRIFCGDLGNEVTDEVLARAFAKYPTFGKAKVVRDKRTNKTRGYGFVSFRDPNDFVKAMREMNGKNVVVIVVVDDVKAMQEMNDKIVAVIVVGDDVKARK